MNSKREKQFFYFSAAVLFLTALAKLYSSGGDSQILGLHDQLLHLGYRPLMRLAAMTEIAVAVVLLWSRSGLKRSLALLWLSGNFIVYRLGNVLMGFHTCPCLGTLTDRLTLPRGLADIVLLMLILYWLLGSLSIFWGVWGAERWAWLISGLGGGSRQAVTNPPSP